MIARQIGIVLCRVGAAVLTVQAIRSLGYTVPGMMFGANGVGIEFVSFALLSAAPGFVAIVLWVYADRISNFVATPEDELPGAPLSGVDLVRIGTVLIGMVVIIHGVLAGVTIEVASMAMPDLGEELRSVTDQQRAQFVGRRAAYLVEILIGVALILGRDYLATLFGKAKYAGVDTGEEHQ